jgi:hypothetical protein
MELPMTILSHLDFAPAVREMHFVHQLADQVKTAAVVGREIVAVEGIGDVFGIKTGAWVADDDGDAAIGFASEGAENSFGGVALRAVEDGVGQRFAESGFDGETIVFAEACSVEAAKGLIGDGGDFFHLGGDAKTKMIGFEIGGVVRRIRASAGQVRSASSATFVLRCS